MDDREDHFKLGSEALIRTLDATIEASEEIRREAGDYVGREASFNDRTRALQDERSRRT